MDRPSIKALATEIGFTAVNVCRADEAWAAAERLSQFVAKDYHGTMAWMEETLERRQHPTHMWPDAKSAVVFGLNYGPDHNPLDALERRDEAADILCSPESQAAAKEAGAPPFERGKDFGGFDETLLVQRFDRPVMVTHWPAEIKAFYMQPDPADPSKALCVDVLTSRCLVAGVDVPVVYRPQPVANEDGLHDVCSHSGLACAGGGASPSPDWTTRKCS